MAEELGKIEKPSIEEFNKGRKLFFVPLVRKSKSSPNEYKVKVKDYWLQVGKQLAELENKLGSINKVYHEFVSLSGKEGLKTIKELDGGNYQILKSMVEKGSYIEAIEEAATLIEFMDWSRCMASVNSKRVFDTMHNYYVEASKKRNEFMANRLNETLKPNDIGVLFMRENHKIQFPHDIDLFYVSPPALDAINRWLRDSLARPADKNKVSEEKKKQNS